jgi:hypothetical protein
MKKRIVLFLPVVFLLSLPLTLPARHQLELETTYLGDGWFRYRLRTVDDPFFAFFELGSVGVPFENRPEYGPMPDDWGIATNFVDTVWNAAWSIVGTGLPGSQPRPYERTFLARSSFRHFKRQVGALITISFGTVGGYHGHATSVNVVGYVTVNALVPCPESEADGSTTNLLTKVTIVNLPDVEILRLVRNAGATHGVTFRYGEASTLRLDGTADFHSWNKIAYLYSAAGITTWSTNQPLDTLGPFYRLTLVAEGHVSDLPPLNLRSPLAPLFVSAGASPQSSSSGGTVKVLRCAPLTEGVEVTVATQPGNIYEISLLDSSASPVQSQSLTATDAAATVRFKTRPLRSVVLVQASQTTQLLSEKLFQR